MSPATTERVDRHTSLDTKQAIEDGIRASVIHHMQNPGEIEERLRELKREWDVERTLEANASALAFAGIVLAALVDRRWLALPAAVTGFLFQHATQGWCPPLPVIRRLGFRTATEIAQEFYALKAIRGDFEQAGDGEERPQAVLRAVGIRRA